jgi:hypothetical protein
MSVKNKKIVNTYVLRLKKIEILIEKFSFIA